LNGFYSQLPALIGVVVGAGASYLATSAGARSQWARTQRVRWEEKRVQVYAEYAHAVKRLYELSKRICASRGLPTAGPPIPVEQGLTELALASIRRAELWESLLLLGNPSAIEAARAWHTSVWHMEAFANGQLTDPVEWREAIAAADKNGYKFYEVARHDVGVDSGPLPKHVPSTAPGTPWSAEDGTPSMEL
jgi:hypothetical protein